MKRYYGAKPDSANPATPDLIFLPHALPLTAAVDLRAHCPPVMDQGALGSCVWHAVTAALRYTLIKAGQPDVPLSRLQGYYDTRVFENDTGDSGCEIRNAMKVVMLTGVAPESLWPYDVAQYAATPPATVYAGVMPFDNLSCQRVIVDPVALKLTLSTGVPVIVGITVFDSFESDPVTQTGIVPMPDVTKESVIDAHAMLCVGYGQKSGYFTMMNSWGVWGDNGFCYLPEEYLGNVLYTSDAWIATP